MKELSISPPVVLLLVAAAMIAAWSFGVEQTEARVLTYASQERENFRAEIDNRDAMIVGLSSKVADYRGQIANMLVPGEIVYDCFVIDTNVP